MGVPIKHDSKSMDIDEKAWYIRAADYGTHTKKTYAIFRISNISKELKITAPDIAEEYLAEKWA
jgi:hypothetical protein